MSIADHFESAPDAGFIRSYDARAARRQFQISLALVLVLAIAAFFMGFVMRSTAASASSPAAPAKTSMQLLYAGELPKLR